MLLTFSNRLIFKSFNTVAVKSSLTDAFHLKHCMRLIRFAPLETSFNPWASKMSQTNYEYVRSMSTYGTSRKKFLGSFRTTGFFCPMGDESTRIWVFR